MSYPPRRPAKEARRVSATPASPARVSNGDASEEDSPSLAPPRPFFLASGERASWSASSMDNSSLDPPSDSDRDAPAPPPLAARGPPPRSTTGPAPRASPARTVAPRNHHRRRSSMASSNAAHSSSGAAAVTAAADTTHESTPAQSEIDHGQTANWSPDTLYQDAGIASPNTPAGSTVFDRTSRPPPSSFPFPFQQYPGNPDPGLGIPGVSRRRSSLESVGGTYHPLSHSSSLTDLRRPYAPFMQGSDSGSVTPPSASSNSIYRNSVAANMMSGSPSAVNEMGGIPRSASTQTFRAPFLSPASRPTSSLWSPPTHHHQIANLSPSASSSALAVPALPKKAPLPSTRLTAPIEKSEKPWLSTPDPRTRLSWWLTLCCIILGIGAAGVVVWQGFNEVVKLEPNQLCMVLDEDFNGSDLDDSVWSRDVELGGFGNGEFQMTTDSSDNLFFRNSQLYMFPTLSEDAGININDGKFTLDGCTTDNSSACTVTANGQTTIVNPVRSARINTKGKKNIRYGRVEFKAKMPKGDWLWPAVWMLPEDDKYGPWPASGEIDIMEARGNGPAYPAQGSNFIRSSLNYGPLPAAFNQIFGWQSLKRSSFDKGFHIYALEWDDRFMRFFVDSRIHAMLDLRMTGKKESFWDRANFPQTVQNGSTQAVVPNIYNASRAAPFDQPFYLIIDLAVGGTSGWFPDKIGNKPWFDGSNSAMIDFANAKDTWFATWPESQEDRSFRIDYVKMWEKC